MLGLMGGLGLLVALPLGCHRAPSTDEDPTAPVGLPHGASDPMVQSLTPGASPTPAASMAPPIDPAIEKALLAAAGDSPHDDRPPFHDNLARSGTDPQAVAGTANSGAYDPHRVISGLVDVAPALRGQLAACPTLFLIARQADGAHTLLAVRKMDVTGDLPLAYALDGSMAVMAGTPPFEGPVTLTARTDRDGDGLTRDSGCLEGSAPAGTVVPAQHVAITLDHVLP